MLTQRTWPLLNVPIFAQWEKKSTIRLCEFINATWGWERETKTGWKADRCYVKLQAPFTLWLWISLIFHFSLASPLSTSICNPLIFPAHSSTTFSLCPPSHSAHTVCMHAHLCVKGMIFWCPWCVWVPSLSTFSGRPLCLQPSYCSPTHSIRNQACVGA